MSESHPLADLSQPTIMLACRDFKSENCPLKGYIFTACTTKTADPIMIGGQIPCWADEHPIILDEMVRRF